MEAREAKLTTVLTETYVLFVPAWQRRYAWDKPQWTKMWAALERAWRRQSKEYFLGAIVAQEAGTLGPVLERRRIIDGQQRLVTLSLFVAALQQRAALLGLTELEDQLKKLLLVDPDKLRLSPWGKDEQPYRACLLGEDYDGDSKIPLAHGSSSGSCGRTTSASSLFCGRQCGHGSISHTSSWARTMTRTRSSRH